MAVYHDSMMGTRLEGEDQLIECSVLCINFSHYSLEGCDLTSSGALALGEALKKSKTLEILEYVVE